MNYKFQAGDLVRIKPGQGHYSGSLVLVIDRCCARYTMDELYTLMLPGGERVDASPNSLAKVSESNEL